MKKILCFLLFALCLTVAANAQTFATYDFEDGTIPSDFTNVQNEENYAWIVIDTTDESGNTIRCIRSGNRGVASSASAIEITQDFAADGHIAFDALCMGEGSSTVWDRCIFYIDGEAQFTYGSAIAGWNHYAYNVSAGSHTFKWVYTKDQSINNLGDAFFVDNIEFAIGELCEAPVSLKAEQNSLQSVEVSWQSKSLHFSLRYRLVGTTPWTNVSGSISANSCIISDLEAGSYEVQVAATCDADNWISATFDVIEISSTATWYGYAAAFTDAENNTSPYDNYFVSFSMQNPEVISPATSSTVSMTYAGCYSDGYVWCITRNDGNLCRATVNNTDHSIGTFETVVAGFETSGRNPKSMSYNPMDGRIYYIHENSGVFSLKSFSPEDPANTVSDGIPLTIDAIVLAINQNGEAYSIEIGTGNLYRLDLTDGTATLVGNTGQSVSFVQSLAFDMNTGELFWAQSDSYNDALFVVDPGTAATTVLGHIGGGAASETTCLFMVWDGEVDFEACTVPYQLNVIPTATTATVSWTEKGAATSWVVAYKAVGASNFTETTVTETSYNLTGLTQSTQYIVKVRPVCEDGTLLKWSEVTFTTEAACETPTNVTISDITANSATVGWTGSSTKYNVRYRVPGVETDTVFFEDFEDADNFVNGLPSGWTSIDNDGDGFNWIYYNYDLHFDGNGYIAWHSGVGVMYSQSYDFGAGALTPDNWLITPQIELGNIVKVWLRAQDPSYPEHFAIYLSTTGNDVTDFTVKLLPDTIATGEYVEYTADLSAYAGQQGYIAIRHFNCTDQFFLNVDDFGVYNEPWTTVTNVSNPAVLNDLDPETIYEVQVQGVCEDGVTAWTEIEEFSTTAEAVCATPTNVSVSDITANSATVDWTGSSTEYNVMYGTGFFGCADEYYYYSENGFYGWSLLDVDGDGNEWYIIYADAEHQHIVFVSESWNGNSYDPDNWLITPTIDLGGTMTVRVRSSSSDFLDNFAIYLITDESEFDGVENTGIELVGETSAPYEWTEYTADLSAYAGQQGHIAIRHFDSYDNYRLLMDFISVGDWTMTANVSNPAELTGLEPETNYQVLVQGICESGVTAWTEIEEFTTEEETEPCLAPTNLTVTNITATDATVSWTENNGADNWQVELEKYVEGEWSLSAYGPVYSTPSFSFHNVIDLTPETEYRFRVKSKCSDENSSEYSSYCYFTTLGICELNAPSDLSVTDITANSATVGWTGSSTEYNVMYGTGFFGCADEYYYYSENGFYGWSLLDVDGDGNEWYIIYADAEHQHIVFVSESWNGNSYDPDNWLITPTIDLGGTMTVRVRSSSSDFLDNFAIYLITDESEFDGVENTGIELVGETTAPYEWTEYTADLSTYAGQQGRIAIRHFDSYNNFRLLMDFISVGDWTMEANVSNPAELTGLEPETTYQVLVQGICESAVTAWSEIEEFTTEAETACVINTIEIYGFTKPAWGEHPDYEVSIPAGAHYSIDYVDWQWWNYDDDEGNILGADDFFDNEDNVYYMYFEITPEAGCTFADNVTVTVNGDENIIGGGSYSTYYGFYWTFTIDFQVEAPVTPDVSSTATWYGYAIAYSDAENNMSPYNNYFVSFSMQNPEVISPATSSTVSMTYAGCYSDGYVWCITRNDGNLCRATVNNTDHSIGTFETVVAEFETYARSMSYNPMDGRIYYLHESSDVYYLKSFSPENPANTVSEDIALTIDAITLAINQNGEAYSIEVGTGNLYRLDLSDGTATLVGNTGQNVQYAQSMAFDMNTGELFWAQTDYDNDALFLVNPVTAETTFLGHIGGGRYSETSCLFMVWDDEPACVINEVNVIGYESPVAGENSQDHLNITVPDNNANYILVESEYYPTWYDDDAEDSFNGTFVEGTHYSFGVEIHANDGCVFANNCTFLVNGEEELVDPDYTEVEEGNIIAYIWTMPEPATGTTSPCETPTGLAASNITATTAKLEWTGSQVQYTVRYKEDAASDWTEATTTNRFFALTGLTPETTYTAQVQGDCGTGAKAVTDWSEPVTFTTLSETVVPGECGPAVDCEGTSYPTVKIGDVCWMAKNLAAETCVTTGNVYAYVNDQFPDEDANVETYGLLYDEEAASATGICPEGYTLPTTEQFEYLKNNYTANELRNSTGWVASAGTNGTGFSWDGSGFRNGTSETFEHMLLEGYLWAVDMTSGTPQPAMYKMMYYCNEIVRVYDFDGISASIRCVKAPETFKCGVNKMKDGSDIEYETVEIDVTLPGETTPVKQCWTKTNLRATKKADGTDIDNGIYETPDNAIPYYYDYSTSGIPLEERGYLYNWPAAMTLCPAGWHLPTDDDWYILERKFSTETIDPTLIGGYRGDHAGKLAGSTYWQHSDNDNAPGNTTYPGWGDSGFSAVPAGLCDGSSFSYAGYYAYFWSATLSEYYPNSAYYRYLYFKNAGVLRYDIDMFAGYSVRCLRDSEE